MVLNIFSDAAKMVKNLDILSLKRNLINNQFLFLNMFLFSLKRTKYKFLKLEKYFLYYIGNLKEKLKHVLSLKPKQINILYLFWLMMGKKCPSNILVKLLVLI